jgi:hypothetical protein
MAPFRWLFGTDVGDRLLFVADLVGLVELLAIDDAEGRHIARLASACTRSRAAWRL